MEDIAIGTKIRMRVLFPVDTEDKVIVGHSVCVDSFDMLIFRQMHTKIYLRKRNKMSLKANKD